ncbi:MAG: hypothetical protein ABIU84_14545 [Thermoanaerobaculia bacterium]
MSPAPGSPMANVRFYRLAWLFSLALALAGDDRLVAIAKVLERDDDPEGITELPPEEDEAQGTIE